MRSRLVQLLYHLTHSRYGHEAGWAIDSPTATIWFRPTSYLSVLNLCLFFCLFAALFWLTIPSARAAADHAALSASGITTTLTLAHTGSGIVTADPALTSYSYGQPVTVTAQPASGWRLDGWSGNLEARVPWWDNECAYRVAIHVDADGYQRFDKPAEIDLNFTTLLSQVGQSTTLDLNSLRVVEIDGSGVVIDADVDFQFDQADDFDAGTNAAGTLVWIMDGMTPANAGRTYFVYFGDTCPQSSVTQRITYTAETTDPDNGNRPSFKLETANSTYIYDKQGGGFSSLDDADGRDWLSFDKRRDGALGQDRGTPNMIHPDGMFHPGKLGTTSAATHVGPIKVTLHSVTDNGLWEAIWEIYPTYAKMTLLRAGHDYWFLYEGTPGGFIDDADYFVLSDGTLFDNIDDGSHKYEGDISGEEWVYFVDPGLARSLFLVHHENDNVADSYRCLPRTNCPSGMTVWGFGRTTNTANDSTPLMSVNAAPQHFTIGLMDETGYAAAAPVVRSAFKDLAVSLGSIEEVSSSSTIDPGTSTSFVVPMVMNRTITAAFVPDLFTITPNVVGSGSVALSDPANPNGYALNEEVTLTATANPGWRLTSWSGDVSGNSTPITLTVSGHHVVTATFSLIPYTLITNTVGSGSIDVSPQQPAYTTGEMITLTANPQPGWSFQGWSGSVNGSTNPIQLTVDGHETATAIFTQDQYTILTDTAGTGSGAIQLSPTKSVYLYGDVVDVTAVADPGSIFGGWSGDLTGSNPTQTVTITGDVNLSAAFDQEQYLVAVGVVGQGGVERQPNRSTFLYDEELQLTAIPEPGWNFARWSGDLDSIENPLILTVQSHTNLTATFILGEYAVISETIGNGTITIAPAQAVYALGDVVELTAVPVDGWRFTGWRGDVSGVNNPTSLTISANHVVTATFARIQYTLHTESVGNGSIQPSPAGQQHDAGAQVTLTALPEPGWRFAGWSGALSGTANPATVTITDNVTVTATFALIPYKLNTLIEGEGVVTVTPTKSDYRYGEEVTVKAIPASGWLFSVWSGDQTAASDTLVFTVTKEIALKATFLQNAFQVTTATDGDGTVTLDPLKAAYAPGDKVRATATPKPGWVFDHWSGDLTGTNPTQEITVSRKLTITANFVQSAEYSIMLPLIQSN